MNKMYNNNIIIALFIDQVIKTTRGAESQTWAGGQLKYYASPVVKKRLRGPEEL